MAPTLLDVPAKFMDCTLIPAAEPGALMPEFPGSLSFTSTGAVPTVTARPAEFDLTGAHKIASEVRARDSSEAFEIALERFQRCAMGLVLTARVPAQGPILASPEALVQLKLCYGADGSVTGAPQSSKFGPVLVAAPSDANRAAGGFLEQIVSNHPGLGALLRQLYLADERAFLAFSRTDEQHALVEYCKILEVIAAQVAKEHKEPVAIRAEIEREIARTVDRLRDTLAEDKPPRKHAEAIRGAQLEIAAANLESQKRQILKAGDILGVAAEIRPVVEAVWELRSSSGSHAGGTAWRTDALTQARTAAIIYVSHFVVSRHLLVSGLTVAEAIQQSRTDAQTPE